MKLLIFDVGGVFRDSSLAMYFGFKRGFEKVGLNYNFTPPEIWHLRGIGKYNSAHEAVKALIAVQRVEENLGKIIDRIESEKILDELVKKFICGEDSKIIEEIEKTYKSFFRSEEAKKYIKVFPFCEDAVDRLSKKYKLAVFTNTRKETVKRDLSFADKFELIIGEDEVKNKKPSGEGITKIMAELGYRREETGYVGDSVVDVLAAKDAKVISIAVLSGMGLKEHLEIVKPDYIFKDILEMSYKL